LSIQNAFENIHHTALPFSLITGNLATRRR
jgi:hypothetical protein